MSRRPSKPTFAELAKIGKDGLKPSTYYRAAHPDLFSDSETVEEPSMPEAFLQFHLDQLTINKKEQEFEEFCRRMAEREICPNLVPQTGPVGGGDSKTDSVTYPVAPGLALRRYWHGVALPTSENWAFAFSAQKDWRAKVRSDVEKVAGLSRKFSKVIFVTNQPAPDKVRARMEAELGQAHDLTICILDRTWIVKKVRENRLYQLFASTLGIEGEHAPRRRLGPKDAAREVELEWTLSILKDPTKAPKSDYALAQSFLNAADYAVQCEHPRSEIDALFLQARSISQQTGYATIIIRAHYSHAWTSFFYYDDPASADRIIKEVEPLLPALENAETAQLFSNVFTLLQMAHDTGLHKQDEPEFAKRISALRVTLQRLATDSTRPNNALHAETVLHLWRFRETRFDRAEAEKTFGMLYDCLERARGLGAYPFLQMTEAWSAFGEIYCDSPGNIRLQDRLQELLKERVGSAEAGRAQLELASQLSERDRPREALRQYAKARGNLCTKETLDEHTQAAAEASFCFSELGFKWAARIEVLAAAHMQLHTLEQFHEFPKRGFLIAARMALLELHLGRVAPFLVWRNLSGLLHRKLEELHLADDSCNRHFEHHDITLACTFMKVAASEVAELAALADTIRKMGLVRGWIALVYKSQGADALVRLGLFDSTKEVEDAMSQATQTVIFQTAPERLCFEARSFVEFQTNIYGVTFKLRSRNRLGPVLFAENLLGVLEAVFAATEWANVAFGTDVVRLFVDEADDGDSPPKPNLFEKPWSEERRFVWKTGMSDWMENNIFPFRDYLMELAAGLFMAVTIDPDEDTEAEIKRWAEDDIVNSALFFSPTSLAIINLFGTEEYELSRWCNAASSQEM